MILLIQKNLMFLLIRKILSFPKFLLIQKNLMFR